MLLDAASVDAPIAPARFTPDLKALDKACPPAVEILSSAEPLRRDLPAVIDEEPLTSLDPAGKLNRITEKALIKLEELLDENGNTGEADYIRLKNFELQVVQTALNTQHKADDSALKARQVDMLPKILELIAKTEKELPARVIDAA